MKSFLVGAALALTSIGLAHADPRLDEKVYDPYVEQSLAELEARSAGLVGAAGGTEQASVFELEYGVSKRLSLALVGVEAREPHGRSRWTDVGVEGVWRLGRIPRVNVDTGLYLEYAHGLNGESDKLEGKILLAKESGRFRGLLNLIVERPLNAPDGGNYARYGYAASATWRGVGDLRFGAELLGDLGTDRGFRRIEGSAGAYVGPQVKWDFRPLAAWDLDGDQDNDGDSDASAGVRHPVELDIDAGWLAAVGPARREAASQARIAIELERKF
jgi:hypothetical protein